MAENGAEKCAWCGATLLARRRYCIECQTPVPGASQRPEGQVADILRHIPSTRRPDDTLVFVPERRAARLRCERRNRRLLVAGLITIVIVSVAAFALQRVNERKHTQAAQEGRKLMARRELDLYARGMDAFFVDVGRYPTAQEGLSVLLKRPSTVVGWRGPYVEGDFSVDPWGNDYVYQAFEGGARYELFSYGPQGEAGGGAFLRVSSGTPRVTTAPKG